MSRGVTDDEPHPTTSLYGTTRKQNRCDGQALISISWRQKESYFIEGLRRWTPSISTEASKSKKRATVLTWSSSEKQCTPSILTVEHVGMLYLVKSICSLSGKKKTKYSTQESLTSGTWPMASVSVLHPHHPSSPLDGFHLGWCRPQNNSTRVFIIKQSIDLASSSLRKRAE